MISCKEVAKILSSGEKPGLLLFIELKLHLRLCKVCSGYATHLKMMKKGFKKLATEKAKIHEDQINQFERDLLKKLH